MERCTVTEGVSALQHYFIAHGSFIAAGPFNLPKLVLFDLYWRGKDTIPSFQMTLTTQQKHLRLLASLVIWCHELLKITHSKSTQNQNFDWASLWI